jgi:hypothetical protein
MKINYILSILLTFILLLNLSSALNIIQTQQDDVKQGQKYIVEQFCANSTYANISNIKTSSSNLLGETSMLEVSPDYYQYNFSNTYEFDTYTVTYHCDENGIDVGGKTMFIVSPQGKGDGLSLTVMIFLIVIIYFITGMGYFKEDVWMCTLGGGAMLAMSVYIFNEGLVVFRDSMTNYLAYLTFGLGAIAVVIPLINFIEEKLG